MMESKLFKWGGWVAAIVVATVAVISYFNAPVEALGNRVAILENTHSQIETTLQDMNASLKDSNDKTNEALKEQTKAITEMGKAIVQLQTILGVQKTYKSNIIQ